MLKSECVYLLNYINKNSISGYFVEEISEIIKEFPTYYNTSETTVKEGIETLKDLGFIMVKYNDGERVCLKATEKGVMYLESIVDKKIDFNYKKLFAISFLGGLLGGIMGCGLIKFIFILIGV